MNKQEAEKRVNLLSENKRNQQAIVNLITESGQIEKIVHQIPGGATLNETQDKDSLGGVIYNWLRFKPDFEDFMISFIGDYDDPSDFESDNIKIKKIKKVPFNHKPGNKVWWKRADTGLRDLAELIKKEMVENENPVSFFIEPEGIFVSTDVKKTFDPSHSKWNPVLVINRKKK